MLHLIIVIKVVEHKCNNGKKENEWERKEKDDNVVRFILKILKRKERKKKKKQLFVTCHKGGEMLYLELGTRIG